MLKEFLALWSSKALCRVRETSPRDPIVIHMNPAQIIIPYVLGFILILPSSLQPSLPRHIYKFIY